MKRALLVVALGLTCLHGVAQDHYKVERESSEFDRFDRFVGPTIKLKTSTDDPVWVYASFGRDKRPTAANFWHVAFATVYQDTDWRFFGSASIPGGELLEAKVLGRKVGACAGSRCAYDESLYVRLTPEQAKQAAADGFRVRWNPKHGEPVETAIPAAYFAAIVDAAK